MATSDKLLRALAVLAAIVVPLLLATRAIGGAIGDRWWIGSAVALACALPIVLLAEGARGQALLGAALAGLAAASTPELPWLLELTGDPNALPVQDLRERPLRATDEYAAVRGYLRSEWVVDEYATGGERPDQNERPEAVLVPLLGTLASEIEVEDPSQLGRVVIARVPPEKLEQPSLQVVRGRLRPAPEEIVGSLFLTPVPALILDSFDMPTRAEVRTRAALALGAGILALVLLILAVRREVSDGG